MVQHRHVAGKVPAVQAVQPVVKLPQLLQRRCRASRRLPQQGRVRHQSTAYHDGVVGKGLPHLPQVTDGGDVPVVAQRQRCVLCRPAEHLPVCCPLVELRPHPWMHRQAADRVCLQQGQQRRPLLRPLPSDTGLDGNFHIRQGIENAVQQLSQQLRLAQQPRSLFLSRHGTGGAAQVQIHLRPTTAAALLGSPDEVLRPVGEDLRHHRNTPVSLRVQLLQFLALEAEIPVGGHEGRHIQRCPAEHLVLHLPPAPAGEPLHRGCIPLMHRFSPPNTSPALCPVCAGSGTPPAAAAAVKMRYPHG